MRLYGYYTTKRPPRPSARASKASKACPTDTTADMRATFDAFAASYGLGVAAVGHDVVPGPRRDLAMIFDAAVPGDVLLVRSLFDVVTLAPDEWARLRRAVRAGLRIVVHDVPETHSAADRLVPDLRAAALGDLALAVAEVTARATIASRRALQRAGVAEAKAAGAYVRPRNEDKRRQVAALLADGETLAATRRATGASLWLVRSVRDELAADAAELRG